MQGIYSLWEGYAWLRMARKRLGTHPGFYAPRVALICPCKGIEPGLEENLTALTHFDYPDYEIYFTLATSLDRAIPAIERVKAASPRKVHIIVAGPPKDCGEKVNNLRVAVEKAGEKFDVLVFTDTDVRAGRTWLTHLVAPLGDARVGATTTFRWYLPSRSVAQGVFWSALASAWNAAIATMLGEHARNFCWGGGTAIRRKTFEEIRVAEAWQNSVSDDLTLTRALQQAGQWIHFVPECLAVTLHDATPKSLLEFTNRQIIITRVYSPRLWALAALAHLSYCVTLLFATWVILGRMFAGDAWLSLAMLMLLVPLLAATKGALRYVAVTELLPEWSAKLQQWSWAWIALAPLVPFLFLWNSVVAAFTRRIRWRGIRYLLVSPYQTKILTR